MTNWVLLKFVVGVVEIVLALVIIGYVLKSLASEVSRRNNERTIGPMDNTALIKTGTIETQASGTPEAKPAEFLSTEHDTKEIDEPTHEDEPTHDPDETTSEGEIAPAILQTQTRTRRRRKRGRPPMTKAAKKAAKVARKAGAKAPKTAALASKKETAVKTAMPMSKMSSAVEARVMEFKPRENTIRKRLLIALCSAVNKHISEADLQVSLYGEINEASKSALGMVLKGVAAMIAKEKLKYTLERQKGADGVATIILRTK